MNENNGLGKETFFDFKYIPTLRGMTRQGQRKSYTFKRPGVELLSYMGLVSAFMFSVCLSGGIYVLVKSLPTPHLVRIGLLKLLDLSQVQ